MGRKLNLSTPTVINTELIPLDESFYIEASGQLEQWYYDNTSQFAPNRRLAPLTLTPHISVFDGDTATSYTPSFYTVRWYENAYNASSGTYVETEIVNQTDSATADYVKSGNNLIVKKNVSYTRGVTIRCEATYIDPRDAGVTYVTGDSVVLSTNRDATVMYPKLDVLAPSAQSFNPLIDNSSQFQFKAVADATGIEVESVEQYRVDVGGTEQMLPENDTTVETCSPKLTIDYGGITQEDQVFTFRQTGGGTVPQPVSDTAKLMSVKGNTVKWNQKAPNVDSNLYRTSNNVAKTITNGVLKLQSTSAANTLKYYFTYISPSTFNVDISHKFYIACTFDTSNMATGTGSTLFGFLKESNAGSLIVSSNPQVSKARKATIGNITGADRLSFRIGNAATPEDGYSLFENPVVIDLTEIFGAGNEPETVADFEAWLDANIGLKDYYPYDAGSLIPVKSTALRSTGFNLWDEQWEVGTIGLNGGNLVTVNSNTQIRSKNFIKVTPNTTYYCTCLKEDFGGFFVLGCQSVNNNNVGYYAARLLDRSGGNFFTTGDNINYIKFSMAANYGNTYSNDVCVSVSNPSRNGTYQAYWEDNVRLDITGITGINPTTGVREAVFPTGMKSAGTVYDEIYVDNGAVKAVVKIGIYTFTGIETWYGSTPSFYTNSDIEKLRKSGSNNMLSVKYAIGNSDKCMRQLPGTGNEKFIQIFDSDFASAAECKTGMTGQIIWIELATPVVYTDLKFADGSPVTASTVFEWYGISNNTEVKADTLPWYVSGQNTSTLTVDAMYGESIRIVLRAKKNLASNTLFPDKVYRTVEWRVPDIDTHVLSENGSAVRSSTNDMSFDTVINVMHAILSDEKKSAHLRFNWKTRKNNVSTEVDAGWGQTTTMDALDLRNTRGSSNSQLASTLVFPYVYLMGAYEKCTQGGEEITQNGETVFDRPVL